MFRSLLLRASESDLIERAVTEVPILEGVAYRFVAGETLGDALSVAGDLNAEGFEVTLDLLGERVTSRQEATRASEEYAESLRRIDRSPVSSTISLKLSQLGLAIDEGLCTENLLRITRVASETDNFVRIDMEESGYVDPTLRVFRRVFDEFRNVGVVIQSYLRRSEADVARLVEMNAPVRLVKGAYDEPESVAYQSRSEIDRSFLQLMEQLLDGGVATAVATHDHRLVQATLDYAGSSLPPESEFQMLYGVRRDYQQQLVTDGHPLRIYLPYGSDWYGYLVRRMAERPANLFFVLRAVVGG